MNVTTALVAAAVLAQVDEAGVRRHATHFDFLDHMWRTSETGRSFERAREERRERKRAQKLNERRLANENARMAAQVPS